MTEKNIEIGSSCLVCGSKKRYYNFSIQAFRVEECKDCGLMCINPQPSDTELAEITKLNNTSIKKTPTKKDYLHQLETYQSEPLTGSLLEIGGDSDELLIEAIAKGLKATKLRLPLAQRNNEALTFNSTIAIIQGNIEQLSHSAELFDYIIISDVLELVRNPRSFLQSVHSLLRENGIILVATPSLDSFSARLMRNNWMEFKSEHLWYFSTLTLKELLYSEDFSQVKSAHVKKTWQFLRNYPFCVVASDIVVIAKKTENSSTKKLSIIMAAYNEEATIKTTIDRVLAKKIPGIEIELIIIESKSTDKTRDIIRPYEKDDRVKIIWQEKPKGKGNAIREGFQHMTGDIVLIQDSDDEYDLEDYDVLLEPIVTGEAAFVLGARHGGRAWKMRQFNDQFWAGHFLNFGHWFFTTLVNVFFGLRLKDPFTMYKVFRTDCLTGLQFECDRFDFDFELLIKLVRNGYRPIEIPVNYRSRSFKEGKKVRVFQDPITWFKAIIRFKLHKI